MRQLYIESAIALSDNQKNPPKNLKKIKCNIGLMIDRDIAEKKVYTKTR